MAQAFIVRRGGGGGSGGTLVVTSSGAGTVTVSSSTLGKSYSKSVTAGGSVTFKGLKTGEWTVTLSNGTQTATRSVTINADYSVSLAYFSATILVTYPANSTCTCTDGTTTLNDTNDTSSTKTATFTVPNTGTWTITATSTSDSSKTKSASVSITADGQNKNVTLSYELVLYSPGDEHTAITGGWQSRAWAGKSGQNTYAPIVTKNESSMHFVFAVTNKSGVVEIANDIILSDYKTLKCKISNFTGSDMAIPLKICVAKRSATYWYTNAAGYANCDSNGEHSLDLTALNLDSNGYDVYFGATTKSVQAVLDVESVWLE